MRPLRPQAKVPATFLVGGSGSPRDSCVIIVTVVGRHSVNTVRWLGNLSSRQIIASGYLLLDMKVEDAEGRCRDGKGEPLLIS
jgi:hypothetical protein